MKFWDAIKIIQSIDSIDSVITIEMIELAIKLVAADAQRVQAEAIQQLVTALIRYDGSIRHTNINIG